VKIAVFGLGYVGTVTAALLADHDHDVVGIDSNAAKVEMVRRGLSPIIEPKLPEYVARTVAAGRLQASTDPDAAKGWKVAFVCVGTPAGRGGQTDAVALRAVLGDIGRQLRERTDYAVVAIRSTLLPHVLDEIVRPALEASAGKPVGDGYGLAVTPEFLREGSSVDDFMDPPFALIGTADPLAAELLEQTFGFLTCAVYRMGLGEAVMVKYASNAFHALKVAFANEIGLICAQQGIDGSRVMDVFRRDTRLNVSHRYLRPGFAFGGSCLPKDLLALTQRARQLDVQVPLLNTILPSNRAYLDTCVSLVLASGRRRVGVFGISFKPGTDDLRESPMVALVETLLGKGLDVRVYDRYVSLANLTGANRAFIETAIPHIASLLKPTIEEVLNDSDVLVVGERNRDLPDLSELKRHDQLLIDFSQPLSAHLERLRLQTESVFG
jgi:GDP-mannose 6-dehydrogenase